MRWNARRRGFTGACIRSGDGSLSTYLRSAAPFWSLRRHEEKREFLAVRQDTLEPPSLSTDRGAMLTAVVDGGYGYCLVAVWWIFKTGYRLKT